jgi:hypothetical protein
LAPSVLFQHLRHHHWGNGLLLSNNVENTFNLYDGCTRCLYGLLIDYLIELRENLISCLLVTCLLHLTDISSCTCKVLWMSVLCACHFSQQYNAPAVARSTTATLAPVSWTHSFLSHFQDARGCQWHPQGSYCNWTWYMSCLCSC